MATWVQSRLGAHVSNVDIVEDIMPIPGGHDPANCFRSSSWIPGSSCSESNFRQYIASQADAVKTWNAYFDEHGVDVIMTPGQPSEAVSYVDAANQSVPVRLLPSNTTVGRDIGSAVGAFFGYWKHIPVPKLMVPVGLDAAGHPLAVLLWGRSPPPGQLYNDSFARLFDLDFLYTAKALVAAVHAVPGLQRADAPLVSDLFEPQLRKV